ncbi:tripartite tricarboxylate transporter substrate binding protein [Verticiella sediminum]|uniref:Tripartite tricarboxylate transporter substrate binding protein n=1 Tax=Verticiella sediminum TaxID=1247510 RepID=A0A556AS19_9BURK|nr:tripartite tricarboxylate transporter substrate binding protein [Verticiella sediminum]TSH95716.1 tripartite tricarboxylate transporter substrate binding protein [Verticiella sediminum]
MRQTRSKPSAVRRAVVLACLCAFAAGPAAAASYPERPIRMIVPYAAGGSTDNVARIVADGMSRNLGQTIAVENRGGAGGKLGIDAVAHAAPDGYTLLFTDSGAMLVNAWLFDRAGSNPVDDFETVGQITVMQNVLVAHPSAQLATLTDLVALAAKQAPIYGSSGTGTLGHLAMEMLRQSLGIELVHVPYKGGAPVTNDLLGGQIPMAALTVPTAAPHIKSGKVVPIAALSEHRTPALPDVPTVAEQGYKGVSAALWQGMYAPAGTPAETLQVLNRALNAVAADQAARERLVNAGNEVTGNLTLEQAAGLVKAEYEQWGVQIRTLGLSVQ